MQFSFMDFSYRVMEVHFTHYFNFTFIELIALFLFVPREMLVEFELLSKNMNNIYISIGIGQR